jgi:hypothetical protein
MFARRAAEFRPRLTAVAPLPPPPAGCLNAPAAAGYTATNAMAPLSTPRRLGLAATACFAVVVGASCASRSGQAYPVGGEDAGEDGAEDAPIATDSTTSADTGVPTADAMLEASGPTAQVRVANWAPDAPESGYDVCVAVHGTPDWSGPLLADAIGDAGPADAAAPSIPFPGVTNYLLALAPAAYDVAVVAGGAGCASPVKVATDLPALVAGGWYTMAIVGDAAPVGADPGLSVVVFTEDPSNAVAMAVRFLDVAPSIASADFGLGTLASGFTPLETGVPFAGIVTTAAADAGVIPDSNGYVSLAATGLATTGSATFSAHAPTGDAGDLAVAPAVTLSPAPLSTVALVGGKTGGARPQLLVCTWDGVVNESSGLMESCSLGGM